MIIDAGLLIAVDRNELDAGVFVAAAQDRSEPLRTTAPVVAQVWRDGTRQARLARLLRDLDVLAFAPDQYAPVGTLLRRSGTSDVVDAHVLTCATRLSDRIVTSDLDDFTRLAAHLGPDAPKIHSWSAD